MYFAGAIFSPAQNLLLYGALPAVIIGLFVGVQIDKRFKNKPVMMRGLAAWGGLLVVLALWALVVLLFS